MSQPLTVSIPHQLGKAEAIRRLKAGFGMVGGQFGSLLRIDEEIWSGNRLSFSATAIKQRASDRVEVHDAEVRIEVMLPWLLSRLAKTFAASIQERGTLLLQKK